jgi:Lrp/AsnC family transcriptional regulator for asnA, asnC and gidA
MDHNDNKHGFLRSTDETDRGIMRLLQIDGRLSNRAIAEELGVSEGTVRNRIRKLKEKGLLKVTAMVNLFEDPDFLSAYVLVRLKTRNLIGAAEAFSKLPGVISVSAVAGQYDLIAELLVADKIKFIDFVTKHMAELEDIASAESLVIFKSFNKWATSPVNGFDQLG